MPRIEPRDRIEATGRARELLDELAAFDPHGAIHSRAPPGEEGRERGAPMW